MSAPPADESLPPGPPDMRGRYALLLVAGAFSCPVSSLLVGSLVEPGPGLASRMIPSAFASFAGLAALLALVGLAGLANASRRELRIAVGVASAIALVLTLLAVGPWLLRPSLATLPAGRRLDVAIAPLTLAVALWGPAVIVALGAVGRDEATRSRAFFSLPLLLLVVPTVSMTVMGADRLLLAHYTRRTGGSRCANGLRQLGVASIAYMTNNFGPGHRKGFMPHARGITEADGPADVGEVFATLVHVGEIDDPDVFVCPSSLDAPARLERGQPLDTFRFEDNDVRTSRELSFGWHKQQATDGGARASIVISADRSTGLASFGDVAIGWAGPRTPDGRHPIVNHPDGRNVLRFDGSVDFLPIELERDGPRSDPRMQAELDQLNLADR